MRLVHITTLQAVMVVFLAACAADPRPSDTPKRAVAADRPLDAAGLAAEARATRTAALIEAALVQVKAADLQRCLTDFRGGSAGQLQPPAQAGWLLVAAALPADGSEFKLRHAAAPELNPEPEDGWQDRITYRALLRSLQPDDGTVACLSCVFDFAAGRVVYRHAYALDTCHGAMPGERALVTVVPVP